MGASPRSMHSRVKRATVSSGIVDLDGVVEGVSQPDLGGSSMRRDPGTSPTVLTQRGRSLDNRYGADA